MFLSLASGYLYRRTRSIGVATMPEESTTAIVQQYPSELTGEAPSEPVSECSWTGPSFGYSDCARFCCTTTTHG